MESGWQDAFLLQLPDSWLVTIMPGELKFNDLVSIFTLSWLPENTEHLFIYLLKRIYLKKKKMLLSYSWLYHSWSLRKECHPSKFLVTGSRMARHGRVHIAVYWTQTSSFPLQLMSPWPSVTYVPDFAQTGLLTKPLGFCHLVYQRINL